MTGTVQKPPKSTSATGALLADYLAYYRESAIAKVGALSDGDQRRSHLPSGWSPLECLYHLAAMEQRWIVWGFLGEDVPDPWFDRSDDRWHVPEHVSFAAVAQRLRVIGGRTSTVLASRALEEQAPPGPRFTDGLPDLAWICFHVLQEYARHVGHLDIAVELAGGPMGE